MLVSGTSRTSRHSWVDLVLLFLPVVLQPSSLSTPPSSSSSSPLLELAVHLAPPTVAARIETCTEYVASALRRTVLPHLTRLSQVGPALEDVWENLPSEEVSPELSELLAQDARDSFPQVRLCRA